MIDLEVIQEAARVLRAGGLVVIPTDTVYGIAADAGNSSAVRTLYEIKGRDSGKPIAMLAADLSDVEKFGGVLTPLDRELADAWWPGPLTLILETPSGSEGFRVPDCDPVRALLRCVGGVLRVTSANLSGEAPALTAEGAMETLAGSVDFVVDGGRTGGGEASTVVKVDGGSLRIVREGALKEELLRARLEW